MNKKWYISAYQDKITKLVDNFFTRMPAIPFEERARISGIRESISYLNTAGIGPCPKPILQAVMDFQSLLAEIGCLSGEGLAYYQLVPGLLKHIIAPIIGCEGKDIAFFSNSSQAINVVLQGMEFSQRDVILTSDQEHPSGFLPLKRLSEKHNLRVYFIPYRKPAGFIKHFRSIYDLTKNQVKLVFLSQASYKNGAVLPIKEVAGIIDHTHTKLFVDSAQYAGLQPLQVRDMDVDFLCFPGHKWWYGPLGTALLYINPRCLQTLTPAWICYNNVIEPDIDGPIHYQPDGSRFECGTYDISRFLGLALAMRMIHLWREDITPFYAKTFSLLQEMLGQRQDLRVMGNPRFSNQGIVSFSAKHKLPFIIEQEAYREHNVVLKAINYPEKPPAVRISPNLFFGIDPIKRLQKCIAAI